MQNLRGGGGANKVHYGRCASGESSYLDQTSLVNKVFILCPNYHGFDSLRFPAVIWYLTSRQATKTLIYLPFSLTLPSVLCVNAKRFHGLSNFFCSQPHEQLTVKETHEGNHLKFPRQVLLFKTVLQACDACSAAYFIFGFPFQFNWIYFTLNVF